MSTEHSPGRSESGKNQQRDEEFIWQLEQQASEHFSTDFMEAQLRKLGLLRAMEESGLLPPDYCPNPYDPVENQEQHDHWWAEHPEEAAQFSLKKNARYQRAYYMFIGAALARQFPDLLDPQVEPQSQYAAADITTEISTEQAMTEDIADPWLTLVFSDRNSFSWRIPEDIADHITADLIATHPPVDRVDQSPDRFVEPNQLDEPE
jgi:hypothetical protein